MSVDSAHSAFCDILKEINDAAASIHSEEDAKIQIIIRVIVEVLGWSHTDISAEVKHENGFSDLIVSDHGRSTFLVEAKRFGKVSIRTADISNRKNFKISGPALVDALGGIEQAFSYSSPNGIIISVLTDGNSWVIFKTFVQYSSYKDKEAIVFPSIESVKNDFATFYDVLSKDGFSKKLYNTIFDRIHGGVSLVNDRLYVPFGDNDISIIQKSSISYDLDKVLNRFFSRLQAENDPDMLESCFVESNESRVADFSLQKITYNVLSNIARDPSNVEKDLEVAIRYTIEEDDGLSVFLVGPTGSGKSTFTARFLNKVLDDSVKTQCLVVTINCIDATGSLDNVINWMTQTLISQFEDHLYEGSGPTSDQLQGLYFKEYTRYMTGVWKHTYDRDKDAFKTRFFDQIAELVEKDREEYLKRLLIDIVHNRKKLPVIITDNSDEFPIEYKEAIFQYTQSLRRHVSHCMTIFLITDKSAWSLFKRDIFNIHQSKSYFLPTPSPRDVFRKRIEYLSEKISISRNENRYDYFLTRGIHITIDSLEAITKVLHSVFVESEYTSKTLGELSNYNIRKTLTYARRVITSSVFNIDDVIKAYVTETPIVGGNKGFLESLLKGDYSLYKRGDDHGIFPLFDVSAEFRHSPLLFVRILTLLRDARMSGRDIAERHISVSSIYDYFDACGCYEGALDWCLGRLIEAGLIEPFDTSVVALLPAQRLAISFSGERHLLLALQNRTVFLQYALTTPVFSEELTQKIRKLYVSRNSTQDAEWSIVQSFASYLIQEDSDNLRIPEGREQYNAQYRIWADLKALTGAEEPMPLSALPLVSVAGRLEPSRVQFSGSKEGLPTDNVDGAIGTVEWFDVVKGFGFVSFERSREQAIVQLKVVTDSGVGPISTGDQILCDVRSGLNGLYVSTIYDMQRSEDVGENIQVTVISFDGGKKFGFVHIDNSNSDAFFHYASLSPDMVDKLCIGSRGCVELSWKGRGRGPVVRRFESLFPPS